MSDNGSIFTSHDTRRLCEQLGIAKQEIKKGRPYQNYIEAAFGVQRRMADWSFEKAHTWEDLHSAHHKWLLDYNHQRHMAHEHRDDDCHSLAAVLNWQCGMQPASELIYRAFSAVGETRVLNKAGYAKFRNFLLYGEQGLAGRETLVWEPGEVEWHVIIRCEPQLRHRKRVVRSLIIPLPLFQISDGTQGS